MINPTWDFEILNIRAESRPSRDLLQDLEDIRAGISISFDPEVEESRKKRKKEARAAAKQKRIEKLEKKIMDIGYENLEEYSVDKTHADKWLTEERLEELEHLRLQRIEKEKQKPVQMTLEDLAKR